MAKDSNIEWCDHTFNPWIGCTKVSPGCAHCYAETLDKRFRWTNSGWGAGKPRERMSESTWKQPLAWNRKAEKEGVRYRVFCGSCCDWLDDEVPIQWLADLLDLIRLTPNLDWLLLTKRPANFHDRLEGVFSCKINVAMEEMMIAWIELAVPPRNVWLGTSAEDQFRLVARRNALFHIPARVKFLSCEPLLERISLLPWLRNNSEKNGNLDWVIVGGESGDGARAFNPDWALSIRDECEELEIAFFMKQIGGVRKPFPEIPADLQIKEFPTDLKFLY